MPTSRGLPPFPTANEHGTAATVKVALLKRERLIDPHSGAPEQHDQGSETLAVGAVANGSHDRDDLLDCRRIGGILLAPISWRAASTSSRTDSMNPPVWEQVDNPLLFEPNGQCGRGRATNHPGEGYPVSAHTAEDRRNGELLVLDGEQVSPFGRDRRALLLHA